MNKPCEPDELLMAQLAAGRQESLERLIRRHATPLLSFIGRMVGDHHRSEELFQEVFLAVWTKRRQYQFPRPFKAWLYAIALNQCRAAFRSPAVPAASSLRVDLALTPSAREPSPQEQAVATETTSLVAAALARLPPRQRAVVVLRVWQGLSFAEIAEVVGRTEATVRSHMHHGLVTMRKYLEPRLR
jgi:RNA polymerase sigma-70 factor (ECF subfamily)